MEILVSNIIFQIINFGVVLGALIYLLYKPILKVFEERSKRIEEGQKAAASAIEQQEGIAVLKEQTEQKLKKETAKVLGQAQEEALVERKQIIAQAKLDAQTEIDEIKVKLEAEYQQKLKDLNRQLVDMVLVTTEKVLGNSLDKKQHAGLIEKELQALQKAL